MKYQLWDMVSYGEGEPLLPFTLLKESDSFNEVYEVFSINRDMPCVIMVDNKKPTIKINKKSKIFESPDNGKTVYERSFGDFNHRKKIK
mgnify:FL=1